MKSFKETMSRFFNSMLPQVSLTTVFCTYEDYEKFCKIVTKNHCMTSKGEVLCFTKNSDYQTILRVDVSYRQYKKILDALLWNGYRFKVTEGKMFVIFEKAGV